MIGLPSPKIAESAVNALIADIAGILSFHCDVEFAYDTGAACIKRGNNVVSASGWRVKPVNIQEARAAFRDVNVKKRSSPSHYSKSSASRVGTVRPNDTTA